MKITIKTANELQRKGKKVWFKYPYKSGNAYFKYIKSAIYYSTIKNKQNGTT